MADFNDDRIADISDYAQLVEHFFAVVAESPGSERYDINDDGFVDISDYVSLVSVFFQTCDHQAPPIFQNDLLNGDFESGDISDWKYEKCCSDSITVVQSPVRSGNYAVRFILKKDDPEVGLSKRSELKLPPVNPTGEYYYSFSIYLPNDWANDPSTEIVAQWHGTPDFDLGETWRNPPLALHIDEDHWRISRYWDKDPVNVSGDSDGLIKYVLDPIEKGVWTDWVFHINWSWNDDGYLQVWKDGKLVIDATGPNMYNDKVGTYFKMGIYKFDWKNDPTKSITSQRTIYHDNVRFHELQ